MEQQKEVEMEETTEQTTLEEKAEIAEQVAEPVSEEETELEAEATPEPITEIPGAEVSSEASEVETPVDEATTKKLAEGVKAKLLACAEDSDCLGALSARLEETAKRLGVPFDALLEEVFGLIKGK